MNKTVYLKGIELGSKIYSIICIFAMYDCNDNTNYIRRFGAVCCHCEEPDEALA
jgi:hypothetical protein